MKIFAIPLALAALLALGACSTTDRPAARILTATHSSLGKITSVRAMETGDRFYVTGTVLRSHGHSIPPGTHIDITLLDQAGRVLATEQDRIVQAHPRQERRRAGRYSFATSFPLAIGRDATHIRITYHPRTHR